VPAIFDPIAYLYLFSQQINIHTYIHTYKIAMIFLEALIVFTVSNFQFHQVKLPWLHRRWWVAPNSPNLNSLDYQVWR